MKYKRNQMLSAKENTKLVQTCEAYRGKELCNEMKHQAIQVVDGICGKEKL